MTALLNATAISVDGRLSRTDLHLRLPQMIAVIGPNGAGKTSFLRALAGIEATTGSVAIDEEVIAHAPPSRRMRLMSFMPATRNVVWPITARDVISLGLPSPDPARVEALIDVLELAAISERPVNHLSTGERSRVLLARALAARPRLLLLDEPLSNLDPFWVLRVLEIVRAETQTSGSSALVSVHDLNQVAAFDRVLLLDRGGLVADGAPQDVLNSSALSQAFRIEREGSGWKIREPA
jgi:iron complex transport system ATP-binding protein